MVKPINGRHTGAADDPLSATLDLPGATGEFIIPLCIVTSAETDDPLGEARRRLDEAMTLGFACRRHPGTVTSSTCA